LDALDPDVIRAGEGRVLVNASDRDADRSTFDACGCKPGTGWNREWEACKPGGTTSPNEAACCRNANVPSKDELGGNICKEVHCEMVHDHPACNAKFGCGWHNATQTCEQKETCCSYFELVDRSLEDTEVLGEGEDLESTMALCDRLGNCAAVLHQAEGNIFQAVHVAGGGHMDAAMDFTYLEAHGTTIFPKGHCRRNTEGTCMESRDVGGSPLDPSQCEEDQQNLQDSYNIAVTKVKEMLDTAREDMSMDTLEECRHMEISSFEAPLTELSAAAAQNVEVCEAASQKVQSLSAPLVTLQADLEKLEKPGGIIEELTEECKDAAAVSEYLTNVRDAIVGLENCPGNIDVVTEHDYFSPEA